MKDNPVVYVVLYYVIGEGYKIQKIFIQESDAEEWVKQICIKWWEHSSQYRIERFQTS